MTDYQKETYSLLKWGFILLVVLFLTNGRGCESLTQTETNRTEIRLDTR